MATPKSSILMGFSLINHPAIGMPQLKKKHAGLPCSLKQQGCLWVPDAAPTSEATT